MESEGEEESIITDPLVDGVSAEVIQELEERRRRNPNCIRRVYKPPRDGKPAYVYDAYQDRNQGAPTGLERDATASNIDESLWLGLIRESGRIRSARLAPKETTSQRIARMTSMSGVSSSPILAISSYANRSRQKSTHENVYKTPHKQRAACGEKPTDRANEIMKHGRWKRV